MKTLLAAGRIALDAEVFLALVDDESPHAVAAQAIFTAVAAGQIQAVTSVLTVYELMAVPLGAGDMETAARYERILCNSANLSLVAADSAVMVAAALLRATAKISTADAMQLASAQATGCRLFVSGERNVPDIGEIRVVRLGALKMPRRR